jgi:hypothetical protein
LIFFRYCRLCHVPPLVPATQGNFGDLQMNTPTSLSALQSWREFHSTEDGSRLFPGLESLRWFLRE